MTAAVVILDWNKPALTRACVAAARRASAAAAHWIVVDNGSAVPLGGLGAEVTLLRNAANLGFSGGVNVGLRHAFATGAEHVWLLNNDAAPLPGALDALLAAARADPAIGLASAVILNADAGDAVDWHGGRWDGSAYRTTRDPDEYASWAAEVPERIWLVGTALLVSRRLVERIGYFDERLFAYWEDNDFSRRSAAAGFRNVVVPAARVRHQAGPPGSHPVARPAYFYYYMVRNELLLLAKTGEPLRAFYWTLRRVACQYRHLAGLPAQRRAMRRGVLDGLWRRGGAYAE
jgi:GT2 family glycosyltransferase